MENRQRGGFAVAIRGIAWVLRTQPHARVHALATAAVLVAGFVLHIDLTAWCLLVIAITLVWAAEIFNTAIEKLCDRVQPEHDPQIGLVKDVAAGAVLVAAIGAAAIGVLVLGPVIARWLSATLAV